MKSSDPFFERSADWFSQIQSEILDRMLALDPSATLVRDAWERPPTDVPGPILAGNGLTCVLENGQVFERAGVNVSKVHGRFSPEFAATLPGEGLDFFACGVSLVFHPRNPHVPTVHMNHRRLSRGTTGWFGGGADLTPYYFVQDDARHFHATLKNSCDRHPTVANYVKFKTEADAYFYLPHRKETRGIGGTFFDYLLENPEETFAFIQDSSRAFSDAYFPIAEKHVNDPASEEQRKWQLFRRGRYVEFNLILDRGTTFGLKTGGRTESILMSMPPLASWAYNVHPEPGSPEAALVEQLAQGIDRLA
jgi:coproporphyrinogen III oxidase